MTRGLLTYRKFPNNLNVIAANISLINCTVCYVLVHGHTTHSFVHNFSHKHMHEHSHNRHRCMYTHTPMHAVEVSNVLALTVQVIVFPLVQVFKAASSRQATIMGSLGGPNKAIIAPKKEPNQPQVGGELDSDCCSGLIAGGTGGKLQGHPHTHTHTHTNTQDSHTTTSPHKSTLSHSNTAMHIQGESVVRRRVVGAGLVSHTTELVQ